MSRLLLGSLLASTFLTAFDATAVIFALPVGSKHPAVASLLAHFATGYHCRPAWQRYRKLLDYCILPTCYVRCSARGVESLNVLAVQKSCSVISVDHGGGSTDR